MSKIEKNFKQNIQVMRLWAKDAEAYAELRNLSLSEAPNAFAYMYEDEKNLPHAEHGKYLEGSVVLGAKYQGFVSEPLVGMVSLCMLPGRLKHMGELTRLYIYPDFRGQGVSDALLNRLYNEARTHWMDGCKLSVAESNVSALKFYQRQGFEIYGRLDEEFHSTEGKVAGLHMAKRFKPATPRV